MMMMMMMRLMMMMMMMMMMMIESMMISSPTSHQTTIKVIVAVTVLLFVASGNATISIQRQTIMRMLWIIITQLWISAASRDKSSCSSNLFLN